MERLTRSLIIVGIVGIVGVVAMLSAGCGDDSPSSPTSTVTRPQLPPQAPAGTVLVIVSGESGAPVANARVEVSGTSSTTDANGEITLSGAHEIDIPLDILTPGFLDRQTRLRNPAASTRYPLWPRTSETGLDETFTFEAVYGALGRVRPMMRMPPGTREAYIVPAAPIRGDTRSMERIRRDAATLTDITHGEIQFIVLDGEEPPSGAVVFELVIDPGDPALVGAVAVAKRRLDGWTITGGTVVYVTLGTVRTSTNAHELGHMFGLSHTSSSQDVMQPGRSSRADDFSRREALAMRLMLKRPPGNVMPDNDRVDSASTLRAPGSSWVSVVACH